MLAGARRKKSNIDIKNLMSSMLIGFVFLYLVFHALNGNHGLYALFKENKRETVSEEKLAKLQNQRAKMEHHVAMISNKTLDLDLLDEQARRVLGYTDPSELIYFLPDDE